MKNVKVTCSIVILRLMLQLVKMYKLPGSNHILADLIQIIDEILGSLTGNYYFAHLQKENPD